MNIVWKSMIIGVIFGSLAVLAFVSNWVNTPPDPKFLMNQAVTYKVPKFYQSVCKGIGFVVGYQCNERSAGGCRYTVRTSNIDDSSCPVEFREVRESELTAIDKLEEGVGPVQTITFIN